MLCSGNFVIYHGMFHEGVQILITMPTVILLLALIMVFKAHDLKVKIIAIPSMFPYTINIDTV